MDDDLCQVCGRVPTAIVRGYHDFPFVDGRNYSLICWTCACIVKYWYEDSNGNIIFLEHPDPEHIKTAAEMMEDGWTKDDAEFSIKAIMRKLKKPKIIITSEQQNIYNKLFIKPYTEMPIEL